MDPQTTWKELQHAWLQCDWDRVQELAQALLQWLQKNGYPPETMGDQRLGADWNRAVATAVADFAFCRAADVLDSPEGIPCQVPFVLSCHECDNEGPDSWQQAVTDGWQNIQYIPTGFSQNFLGLCPVCVREENSSQ